MYKLRVNRALLQQRRIACHLKIPKRKNHEASLKMHETVTSPPSDTKSRPVYHTLEPVTNAQWNLVIAEDEGMLSVIRMLDKAPKGFSARTHVVYLSSEDRKSTRLNSSHVAISYAVFCLKKKTQ